MKKIMSQTIWRWIYIAEYLFWISFTNVPYFLWNFSGPDNCEAEDKTTEPTNEEVDNKEENDDTVEENDDTVEENDDTVEEDAEDDDDEDDEDDDGDYEVIA